MLLLVIAAIEWFITIIFTFYLLWKHAHKETSCLVKFSTFIGWFMGFSILAILPLDIFIVSHSITHTIINADLRRRGIHK